MRAKAETGFKTRNFWDSYLVDAAPKLTEIDLLIKTSDSPYNISVVSDLLYISENEIVGIMEGMNISEIDRSAFFRIMENGSSDICGLYRREVECGSPDIYSADMVSYIYGIEPDAVRSAAELLGIKDITAFTLPLLLSNISA